MAFFIFKGSSLVGCYDGTKCSSEITAELTNPVYIAKARANSDFIEVDGVLPVVKPPPVSYPQTFLKPAKKKVSKKKVSKKKAKKK